jgi:hypothetical protein
VDRCLEFWIWQTFDSRKVEKQWAIEAEVVHRHNERRPVHDVETEITIAQDKVVAISFDLAAVDSHFGHTPI